MHFRDELPGPLNVCALEQRILKGRGDEWVVRIDLDSFIFAMDHLGHEEGDRILKNVGAVLGDFAAKIEGEAFRIGGDDFVLISPPVAAPPLQAHLDALLASLKLEDVSLGDNPHRPADHLSASFVAFPLRALTSLAGSSVRRVVDERFHEGRARNAVRIRTCDA